MMFRRVNTQLLFNVTNPELIPLYEGNDAYEKVEAVKDEEKKATTAKRTKK